MASADVAADCLAPIAAIKAHHIIPVYGTAHRHRRGPNLLRLTRLSKLTDRPMNGGMSWIPKMRQVAKVEPCR